MRNPNKETYIIDVVFGDETQWHTRKHVETLGQLAASTSKPIVVPPHLKPAAVWLESRELAVYSAGRLALLEDALQTKTILRSPILVSEPADRDSQSLWTLRQQLVGSGWTACKPGSPLKPSVQEKFFFVDSQCHYYYVILLDCTLAVTDADLFSWGLCSYLFHVGMEL